MASQFDTVGMPGFNQNDSITHHLQDYTIGNPHGDVVDRTAGDNPIAPQAQGLSTAQGSYIDMQSRPSWLY